MAVPAAKSPTPALRCDISDPPFLLPSAGFFADESLGAGHVHLPDDFFELERQRQLGILAGWRNGVDQLWRRSLVETFREGFGSNAEAPLPERIENFRRYCAQQKIELPADFALALQQY